MYIQTRRRFTATLLPALSTLVALTASASLLLPVTALAQAQSPIIIKFSHVAAVDTPKGQAAEYFKKIVE